jgi:polysaccharide biosynthesis/export protein
VNPRNDVAIPIGSARRTFVRWGAVVLLAAAWGCGASDNPAVEGFPAAKPPRPYSPSDALKEFEAGAAEPYRLGEGDQVFVQVWEKPDLSGAQAVGPDGALTIPLVGSMKVSGMTREEAAKSIRDSLSRLYTGISVTLRVDQYVANRVTVVGRVKTPGVVRFEKPPSVMEAIARAGGLVDGPVNLTHCAVIRGRNRVAWIDLPGLMSGQEIALNLRLRPDDVVLVPEDGDLPVYVLGQVLKPGAYRYTRGMTVMDAIGQAGGLHRDSMPSQILLVRPSTNRRVVLSLDDILGPINAVNAGLERGDIIYVPTNILADIGYVLDKLNAFSWVFLADTLRGNR